MQFSEIISPPAAFWTRTSAPGRLRQFGVAPRILVLLALSCLPCTSKAVAQVIVPGINAPLLPPPPTPPIQVPPIPQLGVVTLPSPQPSLQDTFSDRVSQCNQIGNAGGLTGSDLDAYVRLCVNQ
jgi:hypothetical protein